MEAVGGGHWCCDEYKVVTRTKATGLKGVRLWYSGGCHSLERGAKTGHGHVLGGLTS